ncbi:MAG: peptidyl-prolyl cis-trans isomerase [Limnobacter sp.]|uniref:peptidylprolyl isomerase n=1 Tax=Limnobacter sp. TaxID=2003368 RepID=UPI0032EBED37
MNDMNALNEEFSQSAEGKSALVGMRNKIIMGLAAIGFAGVVGWAGFTVLGETSPISASVSPVANANAATQGSDEVLASINGMKITEMEVSGLLQQGIDKAIVVDRYINKVIAAELGREMYAAEAKATLQAAEREVLSTLYTTRRMEELRKAISDDDVKNYYNANVLDQNFQLWKVSYYLSADLADAQKTLASLKKGEKEAEAQLKPLVEQGDGFATAAAMPYNLGRVVSKMKKGEYSEVLQLRNGLLVLKVDESKQVKKPTVDELKQDIVQALALQKFNEELEQARKKAKVELG